ncbi:MAG: RnfABCDGE type electron transport complex subunit D [Treponema sp.]|nr:RnfABCDGE type electron transport complex subunit D [Treponema sp.]
MVHLSSSPHFSMGLSTKKIMMAVIIALLPQTVAGVIFFGLPALLTVITSVTSCVVFEYLFQKLTKQRIVVGNLSSVVSGLMLALVCPPGVPVWMVIIGAAVAMVVAKGLFGGIGANTFNPALTGRAFMFISFPGAMGAVWANNKYAADALTGATPLVKIAGGALDFSWDTFWELFMGRNGGCIGETSVLLILISFAFLLVMHIIDWRAPVAMVVTVFVSIFLFNLPQGFDAAWQNALLSLVTGGLAFGACFMVTDYATAPVTGPGRLVFGFGCGLITALIRQFGGYPEGVMFSILIMNAVAPFLNSLKPRMYGYAKKGGK